MTTTIHERLQLLIQEDEKQPEEGAFVRIEAIADLPTRFGDFHIVAFSNSLDDKEHVAIFKGDI